MSLLAEAITIAASVHRNQIDKSGTDYILHPLRLMLGMKTDELRIVAVLHDVIEDSSESDPWTPPRLREFGFPETIIEAVECLTRRPNETYEHFIERIAPNQTAKTVKIADLEDNMNVLRLNTIDTNDLKRLERYHRAWLRLLRD